MIEARSIQEALNILGHGHIGVIFILLGSNEDSAQAIHAHLLLLEYVLR
jgi:hypothetical protein